MGPGTHYGKESGLELLNLLSPPLKHVMGLQAFTTMPSSLLVTADVGIQT